MEIMDRDISAGGSKSDLTRYELTLQPQDKVIWLKIPEESNWTKIDMKRLLKKQHPQKKIA